MDSFEWNKIAGAVLFALLLAVGLRIFSEILFESEAPEEPAYVIASAESGATGGGEAAAPVSIATLLASADAGAGANGAKKCLACHTFGEGEANKVGPNLWNVVERPIASHEGYEYSDAMKAYAAEAGTWTFEHLNTFLHDPAGTVPQTKMAFPGLKKDEERANVIAYLHSLSANPVPLPAPEADAPAADNAAAETAAPEGSTAEAKPEATPAEEPAAEQETAMAEQSAPAAEEAEAPAPAEPMTETAEAEAPAAEEPAATEETAATAETEAATPAETEMAMAETPSEQPATEAETATSEEPAAETETAAAEEPAAEPAAEQETASAMPVGDPEKGKSYAKRCLACHSFDEGGPNKVGPHLFGVFDRPIASIEDYKYSDAMIAFSEGGSKHWDAATLDTYLADPRTVVKGTKMAFPGVKDEDRANVIAYLATLK